MQVVKASSSDWQLGSQQQSTSHPLYVRSHIHVTESKNRKKNIETIVIKSRAWNRNGICCPFPYSTIGIASVAPLLISQYSRSSIHEELPWLPVHHKIQFKTNALVHKSEVCTGRILSARPVDLTARPELSLGPGPFRPVAWPSPARPGPTKAVSMGFLETFQYNDKFNETLLI